MYEKAVELDPDFTCGAREWARQPQYAIGSSMTRTQARIARAGYR